MEENNLPTLTVLDATFAVAKLPPGTPATKLLSLLVAGREFSDVTLTPDEISIISPQDVIESNIPEGVPIELEKNYRAFKVEGPLPFELTAILSSIINPLGEAKISILASSTYDTDYVKVKQEFMKQAIGILQDNGYPIQAVNEAVAQEFGIPVHP